MPSPRFDANILAAARRLQDARTSAAASDDANKRYLSALLVVYENDAIRDILAEMIALKDPGLEKIPQYLQRSSPITITLGVGARPTTAQFIISLKDTANGKIFTRVLPGDIHLLETDRDTMLQASTDRPVFYELGTDLIISPAAAATEVQALMVINHVDLTVANATDVSLHPYWDATIRDKMVQRAIRDGAGNLAT
jgi:hypothetical protein